MNDINLLETLEITISSMATVFLILLLLTGIVTLFKFIPEVESLTKKYNKKRKQKYVTFNQMDEDMQVAVLVATIKCKKDSNSDVVLKSVRKL